jgi:hypothetical protein
MNEPKQGQIWETKSGNMALIVDDPLSQGPKMVWYDYIDHALCVADILNRLKCRSDMTLEQWAAHIKDTDCASYQG